MSTLDAKELKKSLAQHLKAGKWCAFTEIPLGSVLHHGGAIQRADVLALKKTYQVRIAIYELKTSKGDFNKDVKEGKYTGYFAKCHQVIFAVPQGLVTLADVPGECGLITHNLDTGWHTVRAGRVHDLNLQTSGIVELLLACLFREQEEAVEMRNLRERLLSHENSSLADRARSVGWETGQQLRSMEADRQELQKAKEAVDKFVGRPSQSLSGALTNLQNYVDRTLPGAQYLEQARELVEIANGLVHYGSASLWAGNAAERLERLAMSLNGRDS